MEIHSLSEIITRQAVAEAPYFQFVNAGSLSVGRYLLAAGATDTQTPHAEDEIYYVLAGRGQIEVAGEVSPVAHGDTIFVAAQVPHRFFDISEDLSLLVFFAPEHLTDPA